MLTIVSFLQLTLPCVSGRNSYSELTEPLAQLSFWKLLPIDPSLFPNLLHKTEVMCEVLLARESGKCSFYHIKLFCVLFVVLFFCLPRTLFLLLFTKQIHWYISSLSSKVISTERTHLSSDLHVASLNFSFPPPSSFSLSISDNLYLLICISWLFSTRMYEGRSFVSLLLYP